MKKYFLLLFHLIVFIRASYSQDIKISHSPFPCIVDWDKVLQDATCENKFIMVNLSTEWCTWCTVMDKKIFVDPEVYSLMDSKLKLYKLDAENDSIGQLLKLKYGVSAYPSFLFFSPKGEYLETWIGAMPKEYWMQYIRDSIDNVPILRPGIPSELRFKWPEFVNRELKANFKKSKPTKEELVHFFTHCDYKQFIDFNVCRFYPKEIPDSLLALMMNDEKLLSEKFGSDLTINLLSTSINWKTYFEVEQNNWSKARFYIGQYESRFPEFEWELFNVKLFYYETKMEVDSLIQLGKQYPSYVSDEIASEIIEFICENGKTYAHFEQASLWNQEEMRQETRYIFAKYQALLSLKMADLDESKKWIALAKDLADKEGIDLKSDTEFKLLIDSIETIKG